MTARWQLLAWVAAALAALLFLLGILWWEHRRLEERWNTFLVGDPRSGATTFQKKGCSDCHAVCGLGTQQFPDLAMMRSSGAGMHQLVTRLWNHIPVMWKRLEATRKSYPSISPEEMANLFAYLYTACYVQELGDARRGRRLFTQKGCSRCHSMDYEEHAIGPNLKTLGPVVTPIFWAQEMWNHAPAMETYMRRANVTWPRFDSEEMNDLLAYIRQERGGPQRESELLPANPERGWTLFQEKGCIACHAVRGRGGTSGPDLAAHRPLPRTLTQLAGQMWNHSPAMWKAMKSKKSVRPEFQGREMADLVAFLYSLGSSELGGSSLIGRDLFVTRKCSRCHGADALGGELGPALRRRGRLLTPINLAQAFWSHGPNMYQKAKDTGLGWPALQEGDLDHLLAFLNEPPKTLK
ncbi:MAG: c-type cytochrome [Acidobacteria bacterium]|nr:c-type cytochrome [Acidobacteriota bacterium]MBI3662673.1 c-type cytochrome [Acidobacteriota bacterium]